MTKSIVIAFLLTKNIERYFSTLCVCHHHAANSTADRDLQRDVNITITESGISFYDSSPLELSQVIALASLLMR